MRYGIRGTGYAVCCTQCEVWVMCLEIWIMRIAVSNVACPSNGIWRICHFDFWHEKSI